MSTESGYSSGQALWTAAATRAKNEYGGSRVQATLRQLTYERFLARVFATDPASFVLKGGNAVLARVSDARATKDVDLLHREQDLSAAVELLRQACDQDLGDHFRFVVAGTTPMLAGEKQPGVAGCRVQVSAYCGVRDVSGFGVDLVVGSLMTAPPEQRTSPSVLPLAGLSLPVIPLYPAVDHIADKVCATAALYGTEQRRSSRVRDLVDLVILARTQSVQSAALHSAVHQEWAHRALAGLPVFDPPAQWAVPYRKEARATPACAGMETFPDAVAMVGAFLAPALSPTPGGSSEGQAWDPAAGTWGSLELD